MKLRHDTLRIWLSPALPGEVAQLLSANRAYQTDTTPVEWD